MLLPQLGPQLTLHILGNNAICALLYNVFFFPFSLSGQSIIFFKPCKNKLLSHFFYLLLYSIFIVSFTNAKNDRNFALFDAVHDKHMYIVQLQFVQIDY